jgi:hypothetical protein
MALRLRMNGSKEEGPYCPSLPQRRMDLTVTLFPKEKGPYCPFLKNPHSQFDTPNPTTYP